VLDVVEDFVVELRRAGLPVSLTESLDALSALTVTDLGSRRAVRGALAATLVKQQGHRPVFDTIFDLYFSSRGLVAAQGTEEAPVGAGGGGRDPDGSGVAGRGALDGGGVEGEPVSPEALRDAVRRLLAGDAPSGAGGAPGSGGGVPVGGGGVLGLAGLARRAVDAFAGMEPGRPVGGTYYLYRTIRQLHLDALAEEEGARAAAAAPDALRASLARRAVRDRATALRAELEAEIRRRLLAERGPEALARALRRPLPEDVDFMHATREEMAEITRTLRPLSLRLATRLARRRRHRHRGALDFRATIRRSLAAGGVPLEPCFRRPHVAKPEIVVLADVSGSVAAFARFTLLLVYALSTQFSKVRSFAFIDAVDEVTAYFERSAEPAAALARVQAEANVVALDGHSDYGRALVAFWARHGTEVGPKTSLLVLGDARNNYHAPEAWALEALAARARHTFWLNPEPRVYWDSGDSVLGAYAAACDGVYECRNLRQLARFVDELA